jgi:hypothetical protein
LELLGQELRPGLRPGLALVVRVDHVSHSLRVVCHNSDRRDPG